MAYGERRGFDSAVMIAFYYLRFEVSVLPEKLRPALRERETG
jgi:hypothetical protein